MGMINEDFERVFNALNAIHNFGSRLEGYLTLGDDTDIVVENITVGDILEIKSFEEPERNKLAQISMVVKKLKIKNFNYDAYEMYRDERYSNMKPLERETYDES